MNQTATLLASAPLPGHYHLLRLQQPQLSQHVMAGHQLRIGATVLPVMRLHPQQGWIELLAKSPQPWRQGEILDVELVGEPFIPPTSPATTLLIGEDLGLAPITLLAEILKKERHHSLLVLLGFTHELPFRPIPSRIMVSGLPPGVIATLPLLEDWLVPGRIAHAAEPPGCFGGDLLTLARHWLKQPDLGAVDIYISGKQEACEAGISLAKELNLGYQTVTIAD